MILLYVALILAFAVSAYISVKTIGYYGEMLLMQREMLQLQKRQYEEGVESRRVAAELNNIMLAAYQKNVARGEK